MSGVRLKTSQDVGILVERDTDSIAKALSHALNQKWDRTKIRAHVEKRTWDVVADEVYSVFKRMA